jgi:hypothetical protein
LGPFTFAPTAPLYFGMDTFERQRFEAQLRRIDLRRSELEFAANTLPPHSPLREDMEAELSELWRLPGAARQADRRCNRVVSSALRAFGKR